MAFVTFKSGVAWDELQQFLYEFWNYYVPEPKYHKKTLTFKKGSVFGSFVYSYNKETQELDLNFGKSKITGLVSQAF